MEKCVPSLKPISNQNPLKDVKMLEKAFRGLGKPAIL